MVVSVHGQTATNKDNNISKLIDLHFCHISPNMAYFCASPGFTWNGLSEEQDKDVTEYATGCFFLGIQASINNQFDDSADAANGIDAWVLGYGNCGE
ncbi:MAG: hypothetical protein QGH27_08530, partial [SAR324 cluster bacterium]|nr:hypothetical protein [SAR324 cluster bacterium]